MEKRIFGATDGIRAVVNESPLRPAMMRKIGKAITKYFNGGKILIGRDTRESGIWMAQEIKTGVEQFANEMKIDAELVDAGIVTTPALAILTKNNPEIKAGIMLTASHNPASDNGVKVFNANGDKIKDAEELQIEEYYFAEELEADIDAPEVNFEMTFNEDLAAEYAGYIASELELDSDIDLSIVMDSAAGAGYSFNKRILESFGIEIDDISVIPNGKNINLDCGALYPEKMAARAKSVGKIGVCYDGDADRVIISDEDGRIWDGDRIVILLAEYLKERGELSKNTVVLTEYSNLSAVQYLNAHDIKVEKVINGDRSVAQKCIDNDYSLGGEFSGHIMFLPWLTSSDGLFVTLFVARILQEKGCRLADLWADYEKAPSKLVGIKVTEKRPLDEIAGWNEAKKAAERRFGDDGRVFARYSGTENKLRILVEGKDINLVNEIADEMEQVVKKEIGA